MAQQDGLCTSRPIIPATGEKVYTHTDYADHSPHALNFTRSYTSRWSTSGVASFAANPGLGQSWAHNYSTSLQLITSSGAVSSINVLDGNGRVLSFNISTSTNTWQPTSGASTLTATTNPVVGYRLTRDEDDSTWQFDASGKLLSQTERNGWTTRYSYNTAGAGTGQLASVTNAFGRSITFSYNSAGQLSSVKLPDGQTTSYTFDSLSRLSSVVYSDKTSKTYVYEDSRWPQSVTGIIDERGTRLATVAYDAQGRAVESGYRLGQGGVRPTLARLNDYGKC